MAESESTSRVPPARRRAASSPPWRHRHLLSLADLSRDDYEVVFDLAEACLPEVLTPSEERLDLIGRSIVNLFYEDSTRTRVSFARAARLLSGDVHDLPVAGTSVNKGESLLDTARTLWAMGTDVLVVRHASSGVPAMLARAFDWCVVNAGDGRHEHPTQGLLDVFTMRKRLGPDLSGRTVLIVGDVVNSRVARSNIIALNAHGARVVCVGPPALVPDGLAALGVEVARDFDAALQQVDVVVMLRMQFERMAGRGMASIREHRAGYALTLDRAARLPDHALIMHPGPANLGLEIDPEVAALPNSVIAEQVTHGVAIRMAVLRLVTETRERDREPVM